MNRLGWIAAIAAAVCGTAAAGEPHDGRTHTHWYLELEPRAYVGAAVAQGTFDDWQILQDDGSFTSEAADDKDTGLRLYAGVDLGRYFAAELGYADFGEATHRAQSDGSGSQWNAGPQSESLAFEAFDLTLTGKLPLSADWSILVNGGLLLWESEFRALVDTQALGPFDFRESDDGNSFAYGAGLQYDGLRPVRVAVTYRKAEFDYEFTDEQVPVRSVAISLAYLFAGSP
jgi:OmpA-OmpF porin, OOP family